MAINTTGKCPSPMRATTDGVFQGESPLDHALPLLILQICIVVVLTRALAFLLRPLRQPRVIAEIVGGILLGPSALGRNQAYLQKVFPPRSLTVLDTTANLGLLLYLFVVGLELDLGSVRRTGKKALSIALAGMGLSFVLGIGISFVLRGTISKEVSAGPFHVFMGVAFSITAFPILGRILGELKLLATDIGRVAMSAAAVSDVTAWILLALAVALSGNGKSPIISLWVFLCGLAFIIICIFVVLPIFKRMAQHCLEGEPVDEIYVCATLTMVLAAALGTSSVGINGFFGAFVIGVIVPKNGPFAGALAEKVEDLVTGLFLPLYFVSSGLKTNVATIQGLQSWGLLAVVICTACFGKIIPTVIVSLLWKVPFSEAVALGLLMNTKALIELIVLNVGKDRGVLDDQIFAIMVLMALFTTFITTPLVISVYKPAQRLGRFKYKHRTIQREDSNSKLRILACFHSLRNIPTLINLIEVSRGIGKKVGLCVYAMHLMELSERSSAILMLHKARKNGRPFWNKGGHSDSNQIVFAFEAFQQVSGVSIRPMTAISRLNSIHEDICASAERKRAAMIILPFHKHQSLDGHIETTRNEFRCVNERVLEYARCSVGIMVDRGLGGTTHIPASNVNFIITVLFFGGPDDHEALAYGARMAEHPGINLVIVRFLLEPELPGEAVALVVNGDSSAEAKAEGDELLMGFKKKRISTDRSIKYEERKVSNPAEIVEAIQEHSQSNLFLVGRRSNSQLVVALDVRSGCPELGPVGCLLTSLDFLTMASVLVVQQFHNQLSLHSLASLNEAAEDVEEGEEFPGRDSDTN